MKFLLWEIRIEPYRLAKIQWMLFKIFGYRPKKIHVVIQNLQMVTTVINHLI